MAIEVAPTPGHEAQESREEPQGGWGGRRRGAGRPRLYGSDAERQPPTGRAAVPETTLSETGSPLTVDTGEGDEVDVVRDPCA